MHSRVRKGHLNEVVGETKRTGEVKKKKKSGIKSPLNGFLALILIQNIHIFLPETGCSGLICTIPNIIHQIFHIPPETKQT